MTSASPSPAVDRHAGDPQSVEPTASELSAGFAAFIDASRRLEQSYAELKARAAAVDLELQDSNRQLQQALAERDAIFAALPLGVVARRGDGSVAWENDEARRLAALDPAAVRVRRAPLPDGELVLLEDRSRIQELEREVHRLDRLAGLSELALGVAHEIKNPLNGAMGFLDLLQQNPDGPQRRRHVERIRQGLEQVDEIVRSLLEFSRPGRSHAPAQPIGTVVAEAATAAGLARGRVVLRGDARMCVDGGALLRVLAVLLRNAREAKGDDVRVAISARRSGGRAELEVRDDGPGVAADLGPRVFEPFVSSKERGTGLGLPLAARVLSFLGGDLSLLNPGEPGACFRVRLPLLRGTPAPTAELMP